MTAHEMTEIPDCVSQAIRNSETSPRYRRPTIQERLSHHGGNVMSDNISSQVAACSESEDGPFLAQDVYDIIKSIKDPEFPQTLEELNVVNEGCIKVQTVGDEEYVITIDFTPTTPHCSLATLIGLCLRVKLERSLPQKFKLDIYLAKGTHSTEKEINKQINDKERIAAAMENPSLREIVENCIMENDSG